MPDREKVEKGLECCSSDKSCSGCPYKGESGECIGKLQEDALALLRGRVGTWLECEMLDGTILYQCSCCSQDWFVPDISLIKYCPMCGAEMEEDAYGESQITPME